MRVGSARRRRVFRGGASGALLALAAAGAGPAQGQTAASQISSGPPPAGTTPPSAPIDQNEVVVNGVKYRDTVLPTRQTSNSTYGLDLGVMDTPRNNTLLSATQLDTLNIEDPRAFSYLTASSYTDSAFGTPNIPRIRGQYADLFINGMRSSFTDNGYGVPPDFDSLDTISITKGPASVVDGPGPGVGGEADLLTKRPSLTRAAASVSFTADTVANRRWDVDLSSPLIDDHLAARFNYSGEDSGSYFYDHFFRKNAEYLAVRWRPNDRYTLDFNTEINELQYTENVGVNRVNQSLINGAQYLQGAPVGEVNSQLFGGVFPGTPGYVPGQASYQVGSPGNPFAPVLPFLTVVNLTGPVPLNTRITIDEAPFTSSRAVKYNAQLIQTYRFNDNLSIENNTFFDYQDSDNQEQYYYADASRGSWTLESRTDVNAAGGMTLLGLTIKNQAVFGSTFRFAHTNYISNFDAETPGVYDLTANPALFVTNAAYQEAYANSYPYTSPFRRLQLGTPGRDGVNLGNTGVSDLYDGALFVEDRVELTRTLSLLAGGRLDAVQNHTTDPLGGAICEGCFNTLPQSHSTGVFGLGQANLSLVYKPTSWLSSYLTFDATQSNNPNGGEGGVNTYGVVTTTTDGVVSTVGTPDSKLLRVDSYLYEAGLKFDLLSKKLFVGTAVFDQKRAVPTGPGGVATANANIRGVEIESNYQPTRNFFATASYSYIVTTLNAPASFYNYPAVAGVQYGADNPTLLNPGVALPGNYIDGAGALASFVPGQKFNDPGIPQHVFNFLANYKFNSGLGIRYGVQVTGPIDLTTSGLINLATSLFVPQNVVDAGGAYHSPAIPWQYTMNAAVFYTWGPYTATASVYNLTDQRNWQSAPTFYGDDFLVRSDPRTVEIRLQAKF